MTNQRLPSEQIVVQSPMSFSGSAARLWHLTRGVVNPWWKSLAVTAAVLAILVAWTVILCWYVLFSVMVIPYRLVRRGSRKRKKENLRHQEMLAAVERRPY